MYVPCVKTAPITNEKLCLWGSNPWPCKHYFVVLPTKLDRGSSKYTRRGNCCTKIIVYLGSYRTCLWFCSISGFKQENAIQRGIKMFNVSHSTITQHLGKFKEFGTDKNFNYFVNHAVKKFDLEGKSLVSHIETVAKMQYGLTKNESDN